MFETDFYEGDRPPRSFDDLIEIYVENSYTMPDDASNELQSAEKYSEACRFRRRILELARDEAISKGFQAGDDGASDIFDEANDIADGIIFSNNMMPFSDDEKKAMSSGEVRAASSITCQSHPKSLLYNIQTNEAFSRANYVFDKDMLESGIAAYISSRFKDPLIDRILLRALTDSEIVAYLQEMEEKNLDTGKSQADMARTSPWWFCFVGISRSFALWFFIAALSVGAVNVAPELIPGWVAIAGVSISVIAFVLSFVVLLLATAFQARKIKERAKRIISIMSEMIGFYREFRTDGAISISYFRKRSDELREHGVVWPQTLWALLDDIDDRGVRSV